jgi:LysM repeat protein
MARGKKLRTLFASNSRSALSFCSLVLVRVSICSLVLSASVFSFVLPACTSRQLGGETTTPSRQVGEQHQVGEQGIAGHDHQGAPGSQTAGPSGQLTATHQHSLDNVPGELPPPAVVRQPHPLAEVSKKELEAMVLNNSEEIGCASLGKTNAGALFGGKAMESSEFWKVNNGKESYGTPETIAYLSHAIERVNQVYPETAPISIGDISTVKGGHFRPHLSHQAGRDVDLGFYYKDGSAWYAHANSKNLDMERTWALIKFTITETDVEVIFLDRSLQSLLRAHAAEAGEDEAWLEQVFGGPGTNLRPMILHEPGHKTHLHIRYYNPIAQETGRRVYSALLKHKKIKPPTYYLKYKVKRGDSLNRIARKHKTTVAILKKANRLRNNRIYANRVYKIPKRGGVVQPKKLVLPARRVPTAPAVAGPSSSAPGSAGTAARAAL